jgi:hypothetical protein
VNVIPIIGLWYWSKALIEIGTDRLVQSPLFHGSAMANRCPCRIQLGLPL